MEVFISVVSLAMFTVGIIGNIWTISAVILTWFRKLSNNRHMLRRMTICIFLLGVSDIMFLTIMAFEFHHQHFISNWSYTKPVCKIIWGIEHISKFASNNILASISFERYLAICKPAHHNRNQFYKIISTIQCINIICLAIPVVYYADITDEYGSFYDGTDLVNIDEKLCLTNIPEHIYPYYIYTLLVICFAIPTLITSYAYVRMIRTLKKRNDTSLFINASRSRVLTLLFIAFILNFTFWGPYWCSIFSLAIRKPFSLDIMEWLYILPCVNCAINWIPYALMNRELRSAFMCGRNRSVFISREARSSARTVFTLMRMFSRETEETSL